MKKPNNYVIIAMLLICGVLTVALFILAQMWQAGDKTLAKPIYALFGTNALLLMFALIIDELKGGE